MAAFGPFALYGPAMGIPSAVPDMEVTSPGTLTAAVLADAIDAIDANAGVCITGRPYQCESAMRSVLSPAHRDAWPVFVY